MHGGAGPAGANPPRERSGNRALRPRRDSALVEPSDQIRWMPCDRRRGCRQGLRDAPPGATSLPRGVRAARSTNGRDARGRIGSRRRARSCGTQNDASPAADRLRVPWASASCQHEPAALLDALLRRITRALVQRDARMAQQRHDGERGRHSARRAFRSGTTRRRWSTTRTRNARERGREPWTSRPVASSGVHEDAARLPRTHDESMSFTRAIPLGVPTRKILGPFRTAPRWTADATAIVRHQRILRASAASPPPSREGHISHNGRRARCSSSAFRYARASASTPLRCCGKSIRSRSNG